MNHSGYFRNIRQGLDRLNSPFFFWCEDDFELSSIPQFEGVSDIFVQYQRLAQIRMRKKEPLLLEQRGFGEISPGIYGNCESYGFWPHFGRTDLMREAAEALVGAGNINVEVAVSRWMRSRNAVFGIWDSDVYHVRHFGPEVVGGHSDYSSHFISEPPRPTDEAAEHNCTWSDTPPI